MSTIPSIVPVGWLAMLLMVAATVLRKRWQRYFALGCAALQVAIVAWLVIIAR